MTTFHPFAPDRFTDSKLFLADIDGERLLIKVFLNAEREQRRALELAKNSCWQAFGFPVPRLRDIQFDEFVEPHVVMAYVSGVGLGTWLKNPHTPLADKLTLLQRIFASNYDRHVLALANRELLLVHTDPNTDNVIVDQQQFCFIDFEHSSKTTAIVEAVAKEVAAFALKAIADIGSAHTRAVLATLLTSYRSDPRIFDKVEELTCGRPLQPLHRLKNRVRKAKCATLVTRYDIADTIRRLRTAPRAPNPIDRI